ncbi:MAG TPA: hypothetical protein VMB80_15090, partial [Candidatus Acidoferrum sp.]|nr:hypothetical protein [Candidatus Acidoferrum sp.]
MKRFNVLFIFFFTALSSVAQTDTNTAAGAKDTNAPATPMATTEAVVPTNTMATAVTRPMSLMDCIQEALRHNLDVQISRYNPQIQLFNVQATYGG